MIRFGPTEKRNMKANGQMLHPFITLPWLIMLSKQIICCERYQFCSSFGNCSGVLLWPQIMHAHITLWG